jgi:peptidoglycan/LPS O-acetylase OafA/YrhL
MGKISYGMYLYHALIPFFYYRILHVLEGRLHLSTHFIGLLYYPYLAEVLEFILLILLSIASYKLIEMPFLRLKRHFEYSRASIPEAV